MSMELGPKLGGSKPTPPSVPLLPIIGEFVPFNGIIAGPLMGGGKVVTGGVVVDDDGGGSIPSPPVEL